MSNRGGNYETGPNDDNAGRHLVFAADRLQNDGRGHNGNADNNRNRHHHGRPLADLDGKPDQHPICCAGRRRRSKPYGNKINEKAGKSPAFSFTFSYCP